MGETQQFVVPAEQDGERLDVILAASVPGVSRMRLRQCLDQEQVTVNGIPQAGGWRARAGDAVSVSLPPGLATAMDPEPIPLTLLYEDLQLIVIEKPAGMVVHPAGRHRSGTLVNALAHHFNVAGAAYPPIRPGVVHRLDRATSGVMVFAKTQRALSRLTVAFQQKRVEKRYLALVHGAPDADIGEWSAPIGADPNATPKWGIRTEGRPATSRYWVQRQWSEFSLLELEPVTGRTNQLRLHCAHFGVPIVGDELFGRGAIPGVERLCLHATRLAFPHPEDGSLRVFQSPLPAEVATFIAGLR